MPAVRFEGGFAEVAEPGAVPLPPIGKDSSMPGSAYIKIPEQLLRQARCMVERGWAQNVEAVVVESLRRYLESHTEELAEQCIREDVTWGLRGRE